MIPNNIVRQIEGVRNRLLLLFMNHKRLMLIICIMLAILFPLMYKSMFGKDRSAYSKFLSETLSKLGINETLHFNRLLNSSVSLEGDTDCNLNKKRNCYTVNKSLVVMFWRESSREKWLAKNLSKIFPEKNFVCMIMIHDQSNWTSYPNREQFIWIYVNAQKRFWYFKRFLTPTILRAYKYIWVLDDDAELLFDPLHYECVITQLNISLSSPGRLNGVISHGITGVHKDFVDKIGRWTDFVEIGPIAVGSSSAWECIWHFMSPFVGLGWGLDLIWCRLLTHNCGSNSTIQKTCAILDVFKVNHLTNFIGSTEVGGRERPAYDQYYGKFHTHSANIAPLANDLTIYSSCIKNQ